MPSKEVDKVDIPDVQDAQSVVPYLQEIHDHYRKSEVRTRQHAPPGDRGILAGRWTHSRCCTCNSAAGSGEIWSRLGADDWRQGLRRATSWRAALASACTFAPRSALTLRCSRSRLHAQAIHLAASTYITKQEDINEKMRAILIDWLVEVHLKFKLMPETLYLTVNLIDRYLEKEKIKRSHLQLVGVTAMFISSKYEEIYAPECRDFVYISDKAYTREQILKMEGDMLSKLNFQLTTPNSLLFLKRFVKVAGVHANPRTKTDLLANYLVELTLQDYKMLKYLPSQIAAAATYLSLKTMGANPWVRCAPAACHPHLRLNCSLGAAPRACCALTLSLTRATARFHCAVFGAAAAHVLHRGCHPALRARHEPAAQERGCQQPAGRAQEVRAGEARLRERHPASRDCSVSRRRASRPTGGTAADAVRSRRLDRRRGRARISRVLL